MKSLGMLQLFTKAVQVASAIVGLIVVFFIITDLLVGSGITIGEFISARLVLLIIFVILVPCAIFLGKTVEHKRAAAIAEKNKIERSYD